ncbi:1-phosphatidylinositol-3-phosphate 5-kinase [Pelomyxa schiedti]|nr:1-phosphatidylinositol-3-phosphate 5-kinase [Pelomyxa schiedti]
MDLILMENIFYNRCLSAVFDLKGSQIGRFVSHGVYQDGNVIHDLHSAPLCVDASSKLRLHACIRNDTHFLHHVGLMDYSLLVGVTQNHTLIIGIIDYMRLYTWDKQAESHIKRVVAAASGTSVSGVPIIPNEWDSTSDSPPDDHNHKTTADTLTAASSTTTTASSTTPTTSVTTTTSHDEQPARRRSSSVASLQRRPTIISPKDYAARYRTTLRLYFTLVPGPHQHLNMVESKRKRGSTKPPEQKRDT